MINKNELIFDVNHQITLAAGQVIQAMIAMEFATKAASDAHDFSEPTLASLAECSDRLNKSVQELAKQKYLLNMLQGGSND